MRTYRRVTFKDRLEISVCLKLKLSQTEIAQRLGFHKSTISREISRNTRMGYIPYQAERLARVRFRNCRRRVKATAQLLEIVRLKLSEHWSPEQIAGRLKREAYGEQISHEAIYRWIRNNKKHAGHLWRLLRRPPRRGKGRYLARRYKPSWLLRIKERPGVINNRERLGDWERDTMLALNKKPVLVLVERRSRYLKMDRVETLRAHDVGLKGRELLANEAVHSITNDNGSEFRDFYLHTCPIYFCDPYKPQQRGTVENTIGLLRQFITNKTDIEKMNNEEIKSLETKMNLRPRKCLDYKTPYEVYHQTSVALVN